MTPALPGWLRPLARAATELPGEDLSRFQPPASGGRPSAVLVLFGHGPAGPAVLLIERATTMRSHAGQPAFPGGATDPGDDGPVGTALREAAEEVGLDPDSVQVFAALPPLWLPPSGFVVTPVLAWWHAPHPVSALDPAEVAAVVEVPVSQLADPANRTRVRHPSGYVGAAFDVDGMLVWGFTAGLLDRLLTQAGWARPWDTSRLRDLPADAVESAARTAPADAPRDVTA
jgi:8-oxo-dGTP pyrophosphatase MutT (NUDIX family)